MTATKTSVASFFHRVRGSAIGAAFLLGLTNPLSSQTISGQVIDSVTGAPAGAGFVVLLGADGEEIARTLTDRNGRFAFSLAPDLRGPLRLRSERIGFGVSFTEPFEVPRQGGREFTLWIGSLPVPLSAIEVRGTTECRLRPGEEEQTAVVWEEARKALTAASWTASQEPFRIVADVYERDLDGFRTRVMREEHEPFVGFFATAFVSRDPTELVREGYVVAGDTSVTFFAPDAEVFQDEGFLETHCFRLTRQEDEAEDLIGLAFEPIPSRDLPDVEGVLWLDRQSSELRSIEYDYTNLEYNLHTTQRVGGTVEFMPLPSGAWIVHRWHIAAPTRIRDERETALAELRHFVEEWRDAGGEVLAITSEDGIRVYQAELAEVIGVVVDSTDGGQEPLAGATVQIVGTWFKGTTNQEGIFRLGAPLEGEYSVTFVHPRADSLRYTPEPRRVTLARRQADTLWLAVPPVEDLVMDLCSGFPNLSTARVLVGTVTDAVTGEPLRGIRVVASWQRASRNVAFRDRRARVTTDASGSYTLCDLEVGLPTLVYAEGDNSVSELIRVSFEADGITVGPDHYDTSDRIWRRDLAVRPTADLPTVVTGIVRDAASGNGVRDASVSVVGTPRVTSTDRLGMFRIEGLAPGTHQLVVRRAGYGLRTGNVDVSAGRPTIVRGNLLALTPAAQVNGITTDLDSNNPLADTWLYLLSEFGDTLVMSRSDDSGKFVLTAPAPGSYYVATRRDGYTPGVRGPFELRTGHAVDVEFPLRSIGVTLEPTTVTGEAPVPTLTAAGFYERQRQGRGVFLDRSAIERRAGARELGDVLRAIPGVTVDFNGLIRFRGISTGPASRCGAPLVFVDGIAVNRREAASGVPDPSQWQRSIDPVDIEAIELYRSPAEVPAQYNTGAMAACGVILIWVRQGR